MAPFVKSSQDVLEMKFGEFIAPLRREFPIWSLTEAHKRRPSRASSTSQTSRPPQAEPEAVRLNWDQPALSMFAKSQGRERVRS